ncbi:hypothetical protein SLS62_010781, partial [Diatrype stigma]
MVSRINSHFKYAHEKLQDASIRNLAKIDQMIVDFKMDPPDKDLLKEVFATISGVAGLASLFVKRSNQIVADIFTLIGGVSTTTNAQTAATAADDLSKFAASAKMYVAAILDGTNSKLEQTLPGFFGNNDDLSMVQSMYDLYKASGIVTESTRISTVSKMLDGGSMIVPVLESDIANKVTSGTDDTIAAILGGLLASLHYIAVTFYGAAEFCGVRKASRVVDGACVYLVRRPKGQSDSETVPDKTIEALETNYGISLDDMLSNIYYCNNRQMPDADRTSIYIGNNRYADCYFTVGIVNALGDAIPLIDARNSDLLPSWVGNEDSWNGFHHDKCSLDIAKDFK